MLEITANYLVLSFPEIDEEPKLHIDFSRADSLERQIPIQDAGGTIRLLTEGQVVVHLRPQPTLFPHPFAVLVSVGGRNAITGEIAQTLVRCPQNYFTTPPQGGIDGYFLGGKVLPFRVSGNDLADRPRLEIKAFSMKSKAFAYYKDQLKLIPGWGPSALRGITLRHGGERHCEPIYEDICTIGDWDKAHEERVLVRLRSET